MKKIRSLLQHEIVWTSGVALLAIVAAPAIVVLVLKALGWVHGASLHTWLLERKREAEVRGKLKKGDKVVSQSGLIGELIDFDNVRDMAHQHRPKLIVAGGSHVA